MTLAERYRSVEERISRALEQSGRGEDEVELIVVTKNHPANLVVELYGQGQRHFGENRDQEARPKAAEVLAAGCVDARWHFVGQLQTNKVKSVLQYASHIHSLDRPSLLKELAKQLENQDRHISCFIELNLTGDPARGGVMPADFQELVKLTQSVERIDLVGVMAVASLGGDTRQDFAEVVQRSRELEQLTGRPAKISMGMSDDFELAIEMGATHIRVGSAITGPRPNYA